MVRSDFSSSQGDGSFERYLVGDFLGEGYLISQGKLLG